VKILPIEGLNIKMQIWDTAGQERFKTITESYYKGAAGVIFVYSVTDRKTFDNLANWIKQVNESHPDTLTKIIVGNKCDCKDNERQVSAGEASKFAKSCGIEHIETSAKENINVNELFERVGLQIK
jgi:Ras-related protein Rab-8A